MKEEKKNLITILSLVFFFAEAFYIHLFLSFSLSLFPSLSLENVSLTEEKNQSKETDTSNKINQLCLHTMMLESMDGWSLMCSLLPSLKVLVELVMEVCNLHRYEDLVDPNKLMSRTNVDDVP